jgi:type III secretion protein J
MRRQLRQLALRGVAALALFILAGCDETQSIVHVPSEKEANRIVVELAAQGIWSDIEAIDSNRETAYSVRVAGADVIAARGLLVERDLPGAPRTGFEQMIAEAGLIPSRSDERAKLMHAMAGELAQTLELDDRVVRARVHIVLPEKDWITAGEAGPAKPSAVVFVKYRGDGTDETGIVNEDPRDAPMTVATVRQVVAAGVEGLTDAADDANRVAVVFTRALDAPAPQEGLSPPVGSKLGVVEIAFLAGGVLVVLASGVALMQWSRRR